MRKYIALCFALTACLLSTNSSVDADGGSGVGDIPILDGVPIVQNFNSLASSGTAPSNVLPAGWYLKESGTVSAADGSYVVGNGSSNSGNAYSFGVAGSTDRALGSLGSGGVSPITYGAKWQNYFIGWKEPPGRSR